MLIARARPLLGTVVSIQVHAEAGEVRRAEEVIVEAFAIMAHIGQVMSAHQPDSDLGRLSRAREGEVLTLDAHTVRVIRAAHYWSQLSRGAFNPCRAALALSHAGMRPGLTGEAMGLLHDIAVQTDTDVELTAPVALDFGGIAKGYAVDCAIDVLTNHGISNALVNAGGDLRTIGHRRWPIDVRHAHTTLINGRLPQHTRIQQSALATSVAGALNPEFVFTRTRSQPRWRSVTVQASSCMAADVLTKWAMQASLLCPDLRAALRQNHGRMWRTS
jgi:thiamine biosynthesis lipoprotein